mmetsp:Transcript_10980/g.34863  ORF Transcript_10980/g.34863 Transcript_10980/m.34863 type:complete len:215 (+) Transcript_10980:94-738(+)
MHCQLWHSSTLSHPLHCTPCSSLSTLRRSPAIRPFRPSAHVAISHMSLGMRQYLTRLRWVSHPCCDRWCRYLLGFPVRLSPPPSTVSLRPCLASQSPGALDTVGALSPLQRSQWLTVDTTGVTCLPLRLNMVSLPTRWASPSSLPVQAGGASRRWIYCTPTTLELPNAFGTIGCFRLRCSQPNETSSSGVEGMTFHCPTERSPWPLCPVRRVTC